ncbi:MAG: glycosyltransferase family 4 protein [Bacteroidales bacterium]|nr:glycosyltransferase family 4 protein [Bacteroidales bacterium]
MSKIGFDAKRAFNNKSGLGNYSRNCIRLLMSYYPEHSYYLYTPKSGIDFVAESKNTRIVFPETFVGRKLHSLWRTYSLARKIKNDELDLYHGLSHELPVGIEKTGIKSIVTIHDLIFLRYPQLYKQIDRRVYLKKFKYAAFHADIIIAISEQTKEDIINYLGVNEAKIRVVYQGCDNRFRIKTSTEEKQKLAIKYNLPQEYLLYVGTIEPRKNLLQIVKAIHTESIEMPLIVVGRPTAYLEKVQEYIKTNQVSNIFFIHGASNEELPGLYQGAKAFIYPSIFEGFGIPILEALCSGVPVITSKGGCFAEAGGPESIYINPEDIGELAAAIKLIISDASKRDHMIAKGGEYAKKFIDQKISENMMNIYKELL